MLSGNKSTSKQPVPPPTKKSGSQSSAPRGAGSGMRSVSHGVHSRQTVLNKSRSAVHGSKAGLGGHVPKPAETVRVYDEDGNDVTPIPLLNHGQFKGTAGAGMGMKSTSQSTADFNGSYVKKSMDSVAEVFNKMESQTIGSFSSSVLRSGGFNDKSLRSSNSMLDAGTGGEEENSSVASMDSEDDEDRIRTGSRHSGLAGSHVRESRVTDKDLEKLVHLSLTESETITLLDLPSVVVSNDYAEEVEKVKIANEKYKKLKSIRANNDNYIDKSVQTFNNSQKNKDVQATAIKYTNAETQATNWLIHDAYLENAKLLEASEGGTRDIDIEALPGLNVGQSGMMKDSQVGESNLLSSTTATNVNASTIFSMADGSMMTSIAVGEGSMSLMDSTMGGEEGSSKASQAGDKKDGDAASTTNTLTSTSASTLAQLNQESLNSSLLIMERAVVGNNYHDRLLAYKDVMDYKKRKELEDQAEAARKLEEQNRKAKEEDDDSDDDDREDEGDNEKQSGPGYEEIKVGEVKENVGQVTKADIEALESNIASIQVLWTYRCELTRGRAVTYMAWNRINTDVLAVAYGESSLRSTDCKGLILCWSVKNPEWPERIYKCSSQVTTLDFSKSDPNLLAAGFMDGVIAIYDVRQKIETPVLENSSSSGKHHDPVWELKWIEKERVMGDEQSMGEILVSVSTDGRVTQHMMRKGLEYTDLMVLKRVVKQDDKGGKNNKGTSLVSRKAGGLCFDFSSKDSSNYLVGTEEGNIHRCSTSYNEQYLNTYSGHTGPIYKVKWNPFSQAAFLSCSSDWTVRLWNADKDEAVLKFQNGKDYVADIAWSPKSSTIFASVTIDGRLEIWDLAVSVLDPVVTQVVLDRCLTTVIFSPDLPCLLVGDNYGNIDVYKTKNLKFNAGKTPREQSELVEEIMATANNHGSQVPTA